MIVPPEIGNRFLSLRPQLEALRDRVRDILLSFTEQHGFAYSSRIKTAESLTEKIEGGRYTSWSDIDDICAFTVVIPSLSSEDLTLSFLRASFEEHQTKLRGAALKDPTVFRFDATRFIGRLKKPPSLETTSHFGPLYDLLFEVQIRSAFEHAWSVSTHALAYKASSVSWERQRLASQMKATVEQLDQLILSYDQAMKPVVAHEWPDLKAQAEIEDMYRRRKDDGTIPQVAWPNSWHKLAENTFLLMVAFHQGARNKRLRHVRKQLKVLDRELEKLSPFPKSVTLHQVAVGVFASELAVSSQRFTPLRTAALETLFPAVSGLTKTFEL